MSFFFFIIRFAIILFVYDDVNELLSNSTSTTTIKGNDVVVEALSSVANETIALSAEATTAREKQILVMAKSDSCVVTALPLFTFFFRSDVVIASLPEFFTR